MTGEMELDRYPEREEMIAAQIAGRGLRSPRLLEAIRSVPREAFVPPELSLYAYEDHPLPIGFGQTISQPYIVALMADALYLEPSDRVLEIGTGSGYGAAVLSRLASEVYTVERIAELAASASDRLRRLGFGNVTVRTGDGALGWPEHAPYDAILVTAAARRVPRALLDQLVPEGRLVMPVGSHSELQELVRIVHTSEKGFERENLGDVAFVPLVSEHA
jgi:protein-L-isoaspartate(D-aspartate) O-methyltransferase